MLYSAFIYMRNAGITLFGKLCHLQASLYRFHRSFAVQSRDRNDLAADLLAERVEVDLCTCLLNDIHHIHSNHDQNADLKQLCRQVKVSLQIGTIDDIQDDIRLFIDQIVSGDNLFR